MKVLKTKEKSVGVAISCPDSPKGITLIALIITIIIMLILAGVTIALAFNGGLFGQAEDAAEKTMIEAGREMVSVTLAEMQGEYYAGGKGKLTLENVKDEIESYLPEIEEVGEIENNGSKNTLEVIYDGCIYVIDEDLNIIEAVEATGLRVKLQKTIVFIAEEMKAAITVTPEIRGENPSGLTVQSIQIEDGEEKAGAEATFEVTANGTYNFIIKLSDGTTHTKSIKVTEIIRVEVEDPVLTGGLTPIKWDGSTWVETTASDEAWYAYIGQSGATTSGGTSKWANAKTSNGSMLVWIPRYEYKITNGYHGYEGTSGSGTLLAAGTAGTIDVNFIPISQTTPTEGYTIHPAFTNTGNRGLGELEGIWVGKFESSNDGSSNIKIVSDVTSWRNINVNTMFNRSQEFAGNNSLSGYDSHMMKNTEWGAVAYLAHSKYGRNGTRVAVNDSSGHYTGIAGTSSTYETTQGQLASTTGNIYGVYDMRGGTYEYVMGVLNNNISLSGFSSLPDTKYYDNYVSYSNEIKGDAVYETSSSATGNNAWFSEEMTFPSSGEPWFLRGRRLGLAWRRRSVLCRKLCWCRFAL